MNKVTKLGIVGVLALSTFAAPLPNIAQGSQSATVQAAAKNKIKKSGKFSFNPKQLGTYKTDKATVKITAVKVMPSSEDGKQVMVFECDITNNSKKEFDLVADFSAYEFIHASQRTDTSNKNLDPGMVGLNDNGDSLEKTRDDVMNSDSVLPGKTVQGEFSFALVNDKKVKLKFADKTYKTIATKSYKVTPQVTQ